ncbi:Sensor protein ZraS [compost metagenome]
MKKSVIVLVIFLASVGYALASQKVMLGYLDCLFFDLKSTLLAKDLKNDRLVFVDLADLKEAGKATIATTELPSVIEALKQSGASQILFVVPDSEFDFPEKASALLWDARHGLPPTLFYSRWNEGAYKSFQEFRLEYKTTRDELMFARDLRIRRLLLSMEGKEYDESLLRYLKFAEAKLPLLEELPALIHMGSKQAYIRYYKTKSVQSIDVKDILKDPQSLKDKVLFIGTDDNYSVYTSPGVVRRFGSVATVLNLFISDAEVMLNIYQNLKDGEFIGVPSESAATAFIFIFVFAVLVSLVFLSPAQFIMASFGAVFIAATANLVAFAWYNLTIEFSRVVIGIFLVQYFGLPYLLIRTMRNAANERLVQEKALAQEKIKRKFLVQAAVADSNLRTVAQVSHDIRSPLMALQIAHKVIKGSISEEAGELIHGSIERLKYIAEDTLSQYRNEDSGDVQVNLKDSLDDLARTFKILYPDVEFKINIPLDLNILWPPHSLARAFTNLFNNSIEAFGTSVGLSIEVTAESFEDRNVIRVHDNGPGIPENVLPQLFQAGGTFGKASGTGLGLYQVRKDLADFGGRVQVLASAKGALFEIVLPRYLDKLEVKVTRKLLVVANGDLPLSYDGNFEVVRYRSLQEAKKFILLEPDISAVTLIMDLVFPNEEETGFDLIESMGAFRPYKIFVCTSLGENDEIRRLSDRYDVLLVTRAMMSRFYLKA